LNPPRERSSLELADAAENILDRFCFAGTAGGSGAAVLVGTGGNLSDLHSELVDRLPQRLVLRA
jgi:hypothetical protein